MTTITLKPGHVMPVFSGHPWVYEQAIARIDGAPGRGDAVKVLDPRGQFLGSGFYSPGSVFAVRILSRDENERLDEAAMLARIERAIAFRKNILGLPNAETTGYRLINAEGDELPGLIVDVYGDTAVMQVRTAGMKPFEDVIAAHVMRLLGLRSVIRSASSVAAEGIEDELETLRGETFNGLRFFERGIEWTLPSELSHKTGYYFDQRENRALLERFAFGRVLDVYSFVGGMGLAAARGRTTSVTCADSSSLAIAVGATNAVHNGLGDKVSFEKRDAKHLLPDLVRQKATYDTVILDPPKLAPTRKSLDQARKAYGQLARLGAEITTPGGLLVLCSCSAAMTPSDFIRTSMEGLRHAGKRGELLHLGGQAPDHLTPPAFPEGRYLKTLFLLVR